jgi:hypothetical protein
MAVCTDPVSARSQRQKFAGRDVSRLLADPGEMTLKVSGSAKEEARVVQIRSAKCTVGSAAGCTLRVRGAGVGRLACWILRGPAGAVVRRLHGPVTLNGGQFEESALKNGDRLRIGGVELEVVDCHQPSQPQAPLFPAPRPMVDTTELETKLAESLATIHRLEAESRQGFQSSIVAADRADQLRTALAAAHEQLEDTCRDLTGAQETIVVQSGTIEAQKREIENQQREIEAIKAELSKLGDGKSASQVEEARRETAAAVRQCAATGAELAQVRSEMAKDQVRWDEERRQYELRLEQRTAEIEALRNVASGQEGAMTVVFGKDGKSSGQTAELEAQIKTLKESEIQSLRLIEADQAAIKGKLELLQYEFECKCNELKAAQDRVTATEQQLAASGDLASRAQQLAQREEGLVEREKLLGAAEQRIDEERGALATQLEQLRTQAEQITADRQKVTQDLDEAGKAREQLELDRLQLTNDRAQVEQDRLRLEQDRAQLEQDRARFEQDRTQIEQNRMQVTECEAKQEALEERELQLESQVADLAEQVAAASARAIELDAHREQLTALQTSLDERGLSLQRQQDELEVRSAELEAKTAELNSLRDEVNAQSSAARGEESRGGVEPAGEATNEESRPQSVVVTSAWQSPEELQQESVENAVDHAEPAEGSGADGNESANVDSVLSRLVKSGLWRGGEAADAGSETGEEASEAPVSQTMVFSEPMAGATASLANQEQAGPQRPPRPAQAHGDDEESIESYMDRLMKRVRGDSTPLASKLNPIAKPAEEATPQSVATPAATTEEPTEEAEEAGEYSPRRTAPEISNMTAMRELANSAARSAIDKHVRKHTGKQVTGKLFGACLTVGTSLMLAYWAWKAQSLPAAVAAAIGSCIGLYWTFAAVRRLFNLMRLNRPQEDQPAAVAGAGEQSAAAEITP